MALGLVRTDSGIARFLLAASIFASVVTGLFFAKWCFANAAAPRAATTDVADLAVWLAPGDPQTHFTAAVLYEKSFEPKDLTRSLEEYERAAVLSPYNYLSWLELGKARSRYGDDAGAERAFLRTLELAPNYSDIQWAYGNFLVRAGRTDEGFSLVRRAVSGRPEYMNQAVITAMAMLDSNPDAVRTELGDTAAVNAALAAYALSEKRYDDAAAEWKRISPEEKRQKFVDLGRNLVSQFATAKHFRLTAAVARDIWDSGAGPETGKVLDGDFETPIKLKENRLFDWQIAGGAEPQIAMSDAQKHGGSLSLYMVFNTMQAADMRSVSQTVAVEPGRSYSFESYFRAELKGGLAWEISDASEGKVLARTAPIQTSPDWTNLRAAFTVPAAVDGVIIRLVRDGCVSSVCPISGKVWFDDLSLTINQTNASNGK